MECHPVISANAYFYDVLGIMARFAKMNGDDDYANKMQTEKKHHRMPHKTHRCREMILKRNI
jgi:hypothetical protein